MFLIPVLSVAGMWMAMLLFLAAQWQASWPSWGLKPCVQVSKKRGFKDEKFGFGGRKRLKKQNDASSAADMEPFRPARFGKAPLTLHPSDVTHQHLQAAVLHSCTAPLYCTAVLACLPEGMQNASDSASGLFLGYPRVHRPVDMSVAGTDPGPASENLPLPRSD